MKTYGLYFERWLVQIGEFSSREEAERYFKDDLEEIGYTLKEIKEL